MTRKQALDKSKYCLEKAEENISGVGKAYESWSLLADRYMVLANEISREAGV